MEILTTTTSIAGNYLNHICPKRYYSMNICKNSGKFYFLITALIGFTNLSKIVRSSVMISAVPDISGR